MQTTILHDPSDSSDHCAPKPKPATSKESIIMPQKRTQIATDSRKELAATRGRIYLDYAKKYQESGDLRNAMSSAEEGIRLTSGPFYIAVRDELHDFVDMLKCTPCASSDRFLTQTS
jgi:hypothetical protein